MRSQVPGDGYLWATQHGYRALLMRNGKLRTMDEAAIVREADRIGRAAWQCLFAERPDLRPPPGFYLAASTT
jgi:hypothetical protein